jgi:hypothetical protein
MNRLYHAAHKALAITLVAAVIATGVLAIHLTHVHASVTVTFGDPVPEQIVMADAINIAQLEPLPPFPQHKPKVPK